MAEVILARHSITNFPKDSLSVGGVLYAILQRGRFNHCIDIICSPKKRAQQTAIALDHPNYTIDVRLTEFEARDVNAQTAHEYVLKLHEAHPSEMKNYGDKLLEATYHYGKNGFPTLLVTHNAVMSAAWNQLYNEIRTFNYLESFNIEV